MMYRACDAGMNNGGCLVKNVAYCKSCTLCGELYIGETEHPVRERFQEHFRDAKTREFSWDSHYKIEHQGSLTSTCSFQPLQAKTLSQRLFDSVTQVPRPGGKALETIHSEVSC